MLLVFSKSSIAQAKIYLKFNPESKEVYQKKDGLPTKEEDFIYQKNKVDSKIIKFYIKGLMFIHEKSTMKKNVIQPTDRPYPQKLLSPKETECYINALQKKYPFGYKYPSKDNPRIFIAVIQKNKTIIAYEVRWQYYIE